MILPFKNSFVHHALLYPLILYLNLFQMGIHKVFLFCIFFIYTTLEKITN